MTLCSKNTKNQQIPDLNLFEFNNLPWNKNPTPLPYKENLCFDINNCHMVIIFPSFMTLPPVWESDIDWRRMLFIWFIQREVRNKMLTLVLMLVHLLDSEDGKWWCRSSKALLRPSYMSRLRLDWRKNWPPCHVPVRCEDITPERAERTGKEEGCSAVLTREKAERAIQYQYIWETCGEPRPCCIGKLLKDVFVSLNWSCKCHVIINNAIIRFW